MAKVNHYLKKSLLIILLFYRKNVNKGLQLKVRKYYEYFFKSKEEEE
jgi:hypothetical protein